MKQQLENIQSAAMNEVASADSIKTLDELRIKYLGKKGELTAILKQMGKLSAEERPVIGQLANTVRESIENAITDAKMREISFFFIILPRGYELFIYSSYTIL